MMMLETIVDYSSYTRYGTVLFEQLLISYFLNETRVDAHNLT
jgi:hypothetical protein